MRRAGPNARVLTTDGGGPAVERLTTYLEDSGDTAAAAAAADAAVLVVDEPGAGASELSAALRSAGAFARAQETWLVVAGTRSALAAAAASVGGAARALADEVVRAFDANRARPGALRLRGYTLDLSARARIMGILNVTPDSFYDGGRFDGVDRARARAAELVSLGAELIDVGGQSYSSANPRIAVREERERIEPVVDALVRDGLGVPLSVDTFRSEVAEAALGAGAALINDCSGLSDDRLAATVARFDAGLVVMHLKGELNRREADYPYEDALGEIIGRLRELTDLALAAGISRDAILVDPGLEFGKEPGTDLEILERFGDLRSLGFPILFAASRKRFIGRVFNRPARELLVPSLAAASLGIAAGACVVRVHDVAETSALVRMLAVVQRENRLRHDFAPA
jgi:dihydropteroate synthase